MPSVRIAEFSDPEKLAPMLRFADLLEIEATVGADPRLVLEYGIAHSTVCLTVVDEAELPIAMFGVVPDPVTLPRGESGIVWLLGSEELSRYPSFILRNSHRWIRLLHNSFTHLWNHVDARNMTHIRWLKWCGFELVEEVEQYGIEGRTFYRFEKRFR